MATPEKKDIVVDMLSWIVKGDFAGIVLNDPKSKVLEKLGPPLGWGDNSDWYKKVPNYLDADVWGYGVWGIFFNNDKLSLISCVARDLEECGWCFNVINGDIFFKKTKEELCAFFEQEVKTRIFL